MEYATVFDKRGTDEDGYLIDCKAWLKDVLNKLDGHISNLSRKMKHDADEDLCFKGILYPPA